jgi:hypothetical protein
LGSNGTWTSVLPTASVPTGVGGSITTWETSQRFLDEPCRRSQPWVLPNRPETQSTYMHRKGGNQFAGESHGAMCDYRLTWTPSRKDSMIIQNVS